MLQAAVSMACSNSLRYIYHLIQSLFFNYLDNLPSNDSDSDFDSYIDEFASKYICMETLQSLGNKCPSCFDLAVNFQYEPPTQ